MYLADRKSGSTIFFKFTTVNSSGAPTALSSAGVTVYRNGSTVPDTTGVALTASFNGVTGLNHVTIDMSSTGFYSSGGSFMAIVSSGAASESLVGYVLAHWTVDARPFASVSTAVNISTASLISTAQTIASVASVTGNVTGSVGSVVSTVQANVAQWRGETPSTLFGSSWVRAQSQFSTVGLETGSSNVNLVEWRGETPSTLFGSSWVRAQSQFSTAGLETASSLVDVANISTAAAVQINAEVDAAIETYQLDHLILTASPGSTIVGDNTLWTLLHSSSTSYTAYSATLHALSLRYNSSLVTSQFSTVGLETASSNVNVTEWRGTAPSTLGTNAFLVPSSTAAILSVVSVSSAIVSSAVSISTASLISTAQTIASVNEITGTLAEPSTGPPQAAPTPAQAWAWQHYSLRHQIRVNSSNKTFFNSSGAVLWTKGLLGDSATYIELIGSTST